MTKRRHTWRPDLPDHRDHHYARTEAPLPDHVDRLGLGNRIEDQGQLGSCTGNSSTSALEIICGLDYELSRLMAYYNGRLIEGTVNMDNGCMIRDVIKGISTYGVAHESLCPYDVNHFAVKPSDDAYSDGLKLIPKISAYQRLNNLDDVKHALARGLPVVFGFAVPQYFEGPEVAQHGIVRLPTQQDTMMGGHAVCAVGYDDRDPVPFVWVRNSWGAHWGIEGYFKMDQKWFDDPRRLVDDMWVMIPA